MSDQIKRRCKWMTLTATSAFALMVGALAAPAYAQTAEKPSAPAADAPTPDVSEIIVTGVRGQPRSKLDSPTPVDVLPAKEITQGGQAGLYQQLGYAIPSFSKPAFSGAATAAVIQTGGLRGLDPDQTLVLVNGQRFHRTALINTGAQLYNGSDPVDLGMIPTSGIERIEVLREGAAAQYGSDAVAGVINVILKDSPGGSISVQEGQNFDRKDGRLTQVLANYGLYHSDTGSLNLFATYIDQKQSNRSIPITGTFAAQLPAGFDKLIMYGSGQDPYRQLQIGFNGRQEIGSVEFYANGVFNKRNSDIPDPGVYNNAANLQQVYPIIFYPQFHIHELDGQLAVGVRGKLSGWDWDLSSTAGENHARTSITDDINASLGPTSPTSFFLGNLISKEWDNSLDVTRKFDFANGGNLQVSFGLQDRYENFKETAGDPASYIAGNYQIPATQQPLYPGQSNFAGQFPTPGAFYSPGFQPSNAGSWSRNIFAAYVELGYSPFEKLFIGAAGRYEHYNDSSGGSFIGKLDGRYKFTDWLTVRGSIGNGFHAPTLAQQHYSQIKAVLNPTTGALSQTAVLNDDSASARALGAQPLRPETSTDFSAGFTVSPSSNFNLTVDGYIVKVNHRIGLTGILTGAGVNAILVANGQAPGLSAQYFTNAIDTRTRGVDIVGTYHKKFDDFGDLRLTAALSLNDTKVTNIIPTPAALSSLSPAPVLFDATTQGYLTSAIPKSKLVLTADWSWKRLEFNVHEIRYGSFSVINNNPVNSRTWPSYWITNADVTLHVSQNVSFVIGANNLFNKYPAAIGIFAPQYGYNQYPRISPFGITGGSYYGRVQVKF